MTACPLGPKGKDVARPDQLAHLGAIAEDAFAAAIQSGSGYTEDVRGAEKSIRGERVDLREDDDEDASPDLDLDAGA
jgi:hypothetical protein